MVAISGISPDTVKTMADAVFVLFLCMVIWLAIELSDSDPGGGKRMRLPSL